MYSSTFHFKLLCKFNSFSFKYVNKVIITDSLYRVYSNINVQCSLVKASPSVQLVVWRYNEFGDKLRDIENRKLSDHMKR